MGLFKQKVGGTVFGNLLRTGVNVATRGVLGNGLLMKKSETLTPQQQTENLQTVAGGVGAAVEAYQQKTGGQSAVSQSIKQGAFSEWLKINWFWLLVPVVGYVVWKQSKKR